MLRFVPMRSTKQNRFMWANHPDIARRWADEAKAKGEPLVQPLRGRRNRHHQPKKARA